MSKVDSRLRAALMGILVQIRPVLAELETKNPSQNTLLESDSKRATLTPSMIHNDFSALFTLIDIRMTGLIVLLKDYTGDLQADEKVTTGAMELCKELQGILTKLTYLAYYVKIEMKHATLSPVGASHDRLRLGLYFTRDYVWKVADLLRNIQEFIEALAAQSECLMDHSSVNSDGNVQTEASRERALISLSKLWFTLKKPMYDGKDHLSHSSDNQDAAIKSLSSSEALVMDALQELENQIRRGKGKILPDGPVPHLLDSGLDEYEVDEDYDSDALCDDDLRRAQLIAPLIRLSRLALRKNIERRASLLPLKDMPISSPEDLHSYNQKTMLLDEYARLAGSLSNDIDAVVSQIENDMDVGSVKDATGVAMQCAIDFVKLSILDPIKYPDVLSVWRQENISHHLPSALDSDDLAYDAHAKWFQLAESQLQKMHDKIDDMLD